MKKTTFKPSWLDRILSAFFPYKVVYDSCGPLLVRYYVLGGGPKSDRAKVLLHHLLKSDADRDLHDHPFAFRSLLLTGGYYEVEPVVQKTEKRAGETITTWRSPLSLVRHAATDAHRLILTRPIWTLVFRSSTKRTWGFLTKLGWVPWQKYCQTRSTDC